MVSLSHLISAHRSLTFCKAHSCGSTLKKKKTTSDIFKYTQIERMQLVPLQAGHPLLSQGHCQPSFLEHRETKPTGCVLLPVAMGVFKENSRQGINVLGT